MFAARILVALVCFGVGARAQLQPPLGGGNQPQPQPPLDFGIGPPSVGPNSGFGAPGSFVPWVVVQNPCESILTNLSLTRFNERPQETLPLHKYKVLETCVLQSLRDKYVQESGGEEDSLSDSPPLVRGQKVDVNIANVVVTDIHIMEEVRSLQINGFAIVSWNDSRLRWSPEKWKVDHIKIESMTSIWVPDLGAQDYTVSSSYLYYMDINCSMNGEVTTKAAFAMNQDKTCTFNVEDYPNDEVTCCDSFASKLYADQINLILKKTEGEIHKQLRTAIWTLEHVTMAVSKSLTGRGQELTVCVSADRKSTPVRIELTIPMAIAAIIGLIACLFPSLRGQFYIKLFALLLQFLCFMFLVMNNPQISYGDKTPKLHKFYEFTLSMTFVSLLVNLLTMALINWRSKMPPPHGAMLIASAINSMLCCLKPGNLTSAEVGAGSGSFSMSNGQAGGDGTMVDGVNLPPKTITEWDQVWIALNNVLSVLLIIVYIIGIIIITA